MKKSICVLLAMGLLAAPAYAAETEVNGTAMTETEEPEKLHGDTECEIKDGIFTIRIQALETDDPKFSWQYYTGNKGDATLVDCLTETDMEEGLAYAGSFRGLEDGEDTIRLVHTNGLYSDGIMDFTVTIKDGKITENTAGSEEFAPLAEEMASVIEGEWEQKEEGPLCMSISLSDDNGFDCVVSDGSGKDGKTSYYTMTAYYDCVSSALVYNNGVEHTAAITDGSETEAEAAETEAENTAATEAENASGEEETGGTGKIGIVGSEDDVVLTWLDDLYGNLDIVDFVKAE